MVISTADQKWQQDVDMNSQREFIPENIYWTIFPFLFQYKYLNKLYNISIHNVFFTFLK